MLLNILLINFCTEDYNWSTTWYSTRTTSPTLGTAFRAMTKKSRTRGKATPKKYDKKKPFTLWTNKMEGFQNLVVFKILDNKQSVTVSGSGWCVILLLMKLILTACGGWWPLGASNWTNNSAGLQAPAPGITGIYKFLKLNKSQGLVLSWLNEGISSMRFCSPA